VGVFLFLIDQVGKLMRPSGAVQVVGRLAQAEIQKVYPRRLSGKPEPSQNPVQVLSGAPSGMVSSPQDGVFLAFDLAGIVALCQLVQHLRTCGFTLFDIQTITPVTRQFGAVESPREIYLFS